MHGQPLSGLVTLTSAGGSATKYPAGANVTLERVIGHRDTGRTACPGEALYTQLDELRTLVETGLPLSTVPAARVSATIADSRIAYGELVPVGGTLVSPDGLPVAGEVVDVQVNNQGRWRTVKRVTTDANGAFGTEREAAPALLPARALARQRHAARRVVGAPARARAARWSASTRRSRSAGAASGSS